MNETWFLALFLIALVLYFLPTLIAAGRTRGENHSAHFGILAINLLFGWTVIGWVIALLMAFTYEKDY